MPDQGVRNENQDTEDGQGEQDEQENGSNEDNDESQPPKSSQQVATEYKYQLKKMKWGLIPFWTKRSPDYGSMLRTINCRDDSLSENRGMWTTMKQRKRCLVICQGFYEWLKKGPSGKDKIPHFVKRKDGELMLFAGLWDCVKYEDAEDKLYTYTIITTDSNKQLKFLHDRMPVIFDAGSEAIKTWLDPTRNKWTKELQSLLKPYQGELECYPVSQEVGKVGNNSPNFIVPIDSKENKKNIANFFANARKSPKKPKAEPNTRTKAEPEGKMDEDGKHEEIGGTENNAPAPVAVSSNGSSAGQKREHSPDAKDSVKAAKLGTSPQKPTPASSKAKRSAVSNVTATKKGSQRRAGDGSQRITNFFTK